MNRGELRTALEFDEQALLLAQRQHDPARLVSAHVGLGNILHDLGEFTAARVHLEQGLLLAGSQQDRTLTFRAGQDPRLLALGYMAQTLWLLGYADQALTRSHEMLSYAQGLSHTFSLTRACNMLRSSIGGGESGPPPRSGPRPPWPSRPSTVLGIMWGTSSLVEASR
jgi:tetratricopeptide (TPR) repeat protein